MWEMWSFPTFPTFQRRIIEKLGCSAVVAYYPADVDRFAQIGIPEPSVQRLQNSCLGMVDVDAVAVLVAVVQTVQRQVEGRRNLAAAEHRKGRLGQHLSCCLEANIPAAEKAVPQTGVEGQTAAGAGAERAQKLEQFLDGLFPPGRVGVLGIAADLLVEPVGQMAGFGVCFGLNGLQRYLIDIAVHK